MKNICFGGRDYIYDCEVKRMRDYYGFSQTHLGNMVGVSRNTMSDIENCVSVPSVAIALNLSRVLQCPVNELFSLVEEF